MYSKQHRRKLFQSAKGFTMDTFSFHMAKEAFTTCIIIRIAFLGKGLNGTIFLKHLAKCESGILRSLVRMKQYIVRLTSVKVGFLKSFNGKVYIMMLG